MYKTFKELGFKLGDKLKEPKSYSGCSCYKSVTDFTIVQHPGGMTGKHEYVILSDDGAWFFGDSYNGWELEDKFKVGDRVKVISNKGVWNNFKIGEVVTITERKIDNSYDCRGEYSDQYVSEEDLELYIEPEVKETEMRVRYSSVLGDYTGTVVKDLGNDYKVYWDVLGYETTIYKELVTIIQDGTTIVVKEEEPKETGTFRVSKKRMKQRYVIAQATTPLLLEKEVNRLYKEGYYPEGGLVYDSYPEAKYPYKQAMWAA